MVGLDDFKVSSNVDNPVKTGNLLQNQDKPSLGGDRLHSSVIYIH